MLVSRDSMEGYLPKILRRREGHDARLCSDHTMRMSLSPYSSALVKGRGQGEESLSARQNGRPPEKR